MAFAGFEQVVADFRGQSYAVIKMNYHPSFRPHFNNGPQRQHLNKKQKL
jgi:hypothetical protein